MAEYVFTKIMFSPEHKEHFYKILTECEKDEVHPKAACNKEGRFYKADFEKIIPLPYYWQRIKWQEFKRNPDKGNRRRIWYIPWHH